ncbi:MAG TPA: GNAT family N-acetyltransferase [Blastocatellia bacterium]|nr:GNAT family N-acetyltransferase [Blastocatellia bacterium]
MLLKIITAQEARTVRHAVLKPDRPYEEIIYPGDDDPSTLHLGLVEDNQLIGVATLILDACPVNGQANDWRLRGMATLERVRNRGVGGLLLSRCIEYAREQGGSRVWCNGRTLARRFYERHGLQPVGAEFINPHTGPHYLFVLDLNDKISRA